MSLGSWAHGRPAPLLPPSAWHRPRSSTGVAGERLPVCHGVPRPDKEAQEPQVPGWWGPSGQTAPTSRWAVQVALMPHGRGSSCLGRGVGINAASPRSPRQRGRLVLLGAVTPCAGAETQTPMWPPCKAPWPSLRGTLCSLLPRGDFHRVYLSLSAMRGCHHGSPPGHISRFTPQCPRGGGLVGRSRGTLLWPRASVSA